MKLITHTTDKHKYPPDPFTKAETPGIFLAGFEGRNFRLGHLGGIGNYFVLLINTIIAVITGLLGTEFICRLGCRLDCSLDFRPDFRLVSGLAAALLGLLGSERY